VPVLRVSPAADLRVFKVVRVSRAYRDPRVVRASKVFLAHLLEKAIQVLLAHRVTREFRAELVPRVRGVWMDPEDITADLLEQQDPPVTKACKVQQGSALKDFKDFKVSEPMVTKALRVTKASRESRVFRDLPE
jgi:hypothetical protein